MAAELSGSGYSMSELRKALMLTRKVNEAKVTRVVATDGPVGHQ
jgi:hypothetical protein